MNDWDHSIYILGSDVKEVEASLKSAKYKVYTPLSLLFVSTGGEEKGRGEEKNSIPQKRHITISTHCARTPPPTFYWGEEGKGEKEIIYILKKNEEKC